MLSTGDNQGSIVTAVSHLTDAAQAARDLRHQLDGVECSLLLVFFSADRIPDSVAKAVSEAFPGIPVAGCSTAGEIQAGLLLEGSITLMAFRRRDFRVVADLVPDIHQLTLHRAYETGRALRGHFAESRGETAARGKSFAILLVDGLSNREELVVTAARCAIGEIPLIGGSAGDAQLFHEATLIFNGHVVRNAAILLLLETEIPFQTFRIQNFEPTPRRYVVTAADTERRVVHELNAAPAAEEYARALGIEARDLLPAHFAAYPFIVRAGNDYFCRAIRQVLDDGSISFFCAIDEGMVLSLARQQDMVSVTRAALEEVEGNIGGIETVLGFDCLWRKVEIDNRQMRIGMEGVYKRFGINGFNTYGEQFNGIHLNQTLTGLALGRRRDHVEE